MLTDVTLRFARIDVFRSLGHPREIQHPRLGVYMIDHFNFEHDTVEGLEGFNSTIDPDLWFQRYIVCDTVSQALAFWNAQVEHPQRRYVISCTEVRRVDQPETGGWRWHKWGPYIGDREPQAEYLYDEPKIKAVLVAHIYEVTS